MITKFKMFESVSELPKVGDYVLIDSDEGLVQSLTSKINFFGKDAGSFFKENFGQIIEIDKRATPYDYYIKFTVPEDSIYLDYLDNYTSIEQKRRNDQWKGKFKIKNNEFIIKLTIYKINYWSNNIEDLKEILIAKKYNL